MGGEALRRARPQTREASTACAVDTKRSPTTGTDEPSGPTLRANPYPEVTDLFCRLPLSTLFYRLEAANLGDLMRLFVRQGVQISHATWFSRSVEGAPEQLKGNCFCQHFIPISGQSDSRDEIVVNKKRKLLPKPSPLSQALLVLPLNIHVPVQEY